MALVTTNPEVVKVTEPIIDIMKFSKLSRLFQLTATVFKAKSLWKHEKKSESDHMAAAQRYWVGLMQEEAFKDELTFLKDASKNKNKAVPSLVNDLNLFLDSYGLIRSKGRISKTLYFSDEVKNPLLLAKNHPLTKLIIKDAHERCQHLGMPTTISFLRNAGYWVPKARQVTRPILSSCTICKKYNSIVLQIPS